MSEVFTHAGVSRYNGEFKVRFCNDALRVKVLAKNGHKDIDIVQLKTPMTKADAVAYLLSIDFDNGNKEVRAALEAAADKRGVTVTAPKAAVKKTTVADTVMAQAKAKTKTGAAKVVKTDKSVAQAQASIKAQLEDAPF